MNNDIARYQTQQVMTASPAKLIFMLYERAIRALKEAEAAIEAGEIEARWRANNRAIEIVTHMWSTLDMENGGEIAENLDRLFSFITMKLADIDLHNDPAPAQEVIALLEPLRDSWFNLAHGREANAAGGAAQGTAPVVAKTPSPQHVSPAMATNISA